MIQNVLLRLDRVSGVPHPPFEKPHPRMNFWVYEIVIPPISKNPMQVIQKKISEIKNQIPPRSGPTLFIEHTSSHPVFRIPASLITLLAELDCSLEIYRADEFGLPFPPLMS